MKIRNYKDDRRKTEFESELFKQAANFLLFAVAVNFVDRYKESYSILTTEAEELLKKNLISSLWLAKRDVDPNFMGAFLRDLEKKD